MSVYVVMAAGGSGNRMQADRNKVLLTLCGETVLSRSIRLFSGLVDGMVIVYRSSDRESVETAARNAGVSFPVSFAAGGDSRQQSVYNGLKSLTASENDIVLVHDAARCLTPRTVIEGVINACREHGSGVPGVAAVNTMKYVAPDHRIVSAVDRSGLFEIQTPQGFLFGKLIKAYQRSDRDGFVATDDASVMEYCGEKVYITEGSKMNIKITEKEDLLVAGGILSGSSRTPFRIGTGYDVHRLTENRKLILCGIELPHTLGLLGHSDADVGLHALMDAMLGALSLGDIGKHFPDTSDDYKGISSLLLLREVNRLIREAGYTLANADITLIAQRPKIGPFIPEMVRIVSETLGCDPEQISIKATTTEKLGFEGREEGIAAQAVCLLQRNDQ